MGMIGREIRRLEDEIVSLRERLRIAEDFKDFEKCDNPLRPEITCASLVRDNDTLRAALKSAEAKIDHIGRICRASHSGYVLKQQIFEALADAASEGIAP